MSKQLLIYERAVPVTRQRHGAWSVKAGASFEFARSVNSVPLMVAEFPNAAAEYTIVFGGAEDVLPGSAALFQERMAVAAKTIPNGRLHLIPGLGHVPHLEAPGQTYPPLVAFLREGL